MGRRHPVSARVKQQKGLEAFTDDSPLPAIPGAYVLSMRVTNPLVLDIATLGHPRLSPGHHYYCGSAHGPGGLRARIERHLRTVKRIHWHIDHLIQAANITGYWYTTQRDECELVSLLLDQAAGRAPISGFGATDCRQCGAHLISAATGLAARVLNMQPDLHSSTHPSQPA